mgnify:FL=1|jgi:hypothetical protein
MEPLLHTLSNYTPTNLVFQYPPVISELQNVLAALELVHLEFVYRLEVVAFVTKDSTAGADDGQILATNNLQRLVMD